MFPWDIAKLNGIMYDAENEKQAAFIEDLCEGCPCRSPPDHPKLAERGVKQWWYTKSLGNKHETTAGKKISVTASAKVADKEEYNNMKKSLASGSSENLQACTNKNPKKPRVDPNAEADPK
eukprot:11036040-Lingulodinium_polyedra.AAC.1